MGLFSSEKRTVVGTNAVRVIKDEMLPDSIKTGLAKSLFGEDNIAEGTIEALIGSVGVRAERMYSYGRDHYTHGLPSGQYLSAIDGKDEVTALISGLEGVPITLVYSHYRSRNFVHIGWMTLCSMYGYNTVTNELASLSATVGKAVYLEDMMAVVPAGTINDYQIGALDIWGYPATWGYTPIRTFQSKTGKLRKRTPIVASVDATEPYVRVTYVWETGAAPIFIDGVLQPTPVGRDTFNIPVSAYDVKADYFHAMYKRGDVSKYVMYKAGSGTYPTLDAIFNHAPGTNGTFFPFAYFRYNYVSEVTDKTTAAYQTSKKLVKYLGMDYDKVADAIDESPNIADVLQAMMVLAVPATTSNALERRYLFAFFDNLFYQDNNQYASPEWASVVEASSDDPDGSSTSLLIQDKRFKMALSNDGIYKRLITETLGPVGTYSSAVEEIMVTETYTVGWLEDKQTLTREVPIKVHVYKKQVSRLMCEEIRVEHLKMLYYVLGDYTVTADGLSDTLLIPVDHSITKHYSIADREVLYSRAMHYIFNSVQIVTIEWYQQGWFSGLLRIVAIVITIYSLGSATGPMATLMAALAAGTSAAISAAILAILEQLLIGLAIGSAFKLFVKAVGGEIAILLAAVAMVYGVYDVYTAGSLSGAPWAKTLLEVSSGLTKAVSANLQDLTKDLLAEYQTFNLFKDEATKQLEEANKLLEHKTWLNPFVIFGESPNDFYNRTVHSGNIGMVGISAISSYVDTALTLPKLDQSIGENTYG